VTDRRVPGGSGRPYTGPERRGQRAEVRDNGDADEGFRAGWRGLWISVRGPVSLILMAIAADIGVTVWVADREQSERRVVEQEARLEVAAIKAAQSVIVNSVARYCGVPELSDELKRIEAEYLRRRAYINEQREKLGIPRIGPPQAGPGMPRGAPPRVDTETLP
jgi:hypothetical protein